MNPLLTQCLSLKTRQWLGDNGEIVVELPRETEDGVFNELEATDTAGTGGEANAAANNDPKGRAKAKTKIRRFTAVSGHDTPLSNLIW